MTQTELIAFAETMFKECIDIMKLKNSDYANSTEHPDAFLNLSMVENYKVASTEAGLFTRISDKMSRLAKFISSGNLQVKEEAANDTINDMINYLVLLVAYMHSKKRIKDPNIITVNQLQEIQLKSLENGMNIIHTYEPIKPLVPPIKGGW